MDGIITLKFAIINNNAWETETNFHLISINDLPNVRAPATSFPIKTAFKCGKNRMREKRARNANIDGS